MDLQNGSQTDETAQKLLQAVETAGSAGTRFEDLTEHMNLRFEALFPIVRNLESEGQIALVVLENQYRLFVTRRIPRQAKRIPLSGTKLND